MNIKTLNFILNNKNPYDILFDIARIKFEGKNSNATFGCYELNGEFYYEIRIQHNNRNTNCYSFKIKSEIENFKKAVKRINYFC